MHDLDSVKPRVIGKKFPFLQPHDVLAFMHEEVGAKTPRSHVQFYWDWGKRFQCSWAAKGDASLIPVGLYGDEAKYADGPPQEKILGIYLNFVLFRPATVRHSRFMIFSIRSRWMIDTHTLYPLFWKLVESLHYAYLGVRPDGTQLCTDGARFVVTELRGDLAFHKLCWQFPQRGWSSRDVCFWCNASSKKKPFYTDLGDEAEWKDSVFTDTWDWAANTLPNKLCDSARDSRRSVFTSKLSPRSFLGVTRLLSEHAKNVLNAQREPWGPPNCEWERVDPWPCLRFSIMA